MPEEINLPNLVSHLEVSLANTSGVIMDAARQGSSVGAALGQSLQDTFRTIADELPEVEIDGNTEQVDRDLHRVRRQLAALSDRRIGVDVSVEEAMRRLAELEPHLERLSHEHPDITVRTNVGQAQRELAALVAAARAVDEQDIDVDIEMDEDARRESEALSAALARLGDVGRRAGSALASAGTTIAAAGMAVSAAVPAAAGLATAVAQVGPAAAVAVSGMAAMQLVSGTLRFGMIGVADAVELAFDPDADPEELAKAMENLSPAARDFVTELRGMRGAFDDLRLRVQERLFDGLDDSLGDLAKSAGPVLSSAMERTADSLNAMGRGAAQAATELAEDGTLGKATDHATDALGELEQVPAQVVRALGQIAAVGGPLLERFARRVAASAEDISDRINTAFKTGELEASINRAGDVLKQLGRIAGNVRDSIGNVVDALDTSSAGLFDTLESLTQLLEDATASEGFQQALQALSGVAQEITESVGPLLLEALEAIGPVFEELGPPIERFIDVLGGTLTELVDEFGPSLRILGDALGEFIDAVRPLVEAGGEVAAAFRPIAEEVFTQLREIMIELQPTFQELANVMREDVVPLIKELTPLINQFTQIAGELAKVALPLLAGAFRLLGPLIGGVTSILHELNPLVQKGNGYVKTFAVDVRDQLGTALVDGRVKFEQFLGGAQRVASYVLGPGRSAFNSLTSTLNGPFGQGVLRATQRVHDFVIQSARNLGTLPGRANSALASFAGTLGRIAGQAGRALISGISSFLSSAVRLISGLPGRARGALGDLGGLLFSSGAALIRGFISGITSMIDRVRSAASSVAEAARDFFPFSPAKAGPFSGRGWVLYSGQALSEAFADGIRQRSAAVAAATRTVMNAAQPGMTAALAAGGGAGAARVQVPRFDLAAAPAGGGDVHTTFHLHQTDATPDGILRALSWQGLVGRR